DAMRLVRVRGTAMAAASAVEPTGMTAVLGGEAEAVLAAIASKGLTPANVNGAGQIVAAGTLADLEAFAAAPPAGARLRPLQVAGAFHTGHMASAVAALRDAAAGIPVRDPAMTLLSDADGAAVTTGKEWLERIIAQVAAPVRWDLCTRTMADLGVTAIIELPPAGTLTGLARRALPGVAQLAIKTPDQLDAARELIEEHLADSDRHSHGHLPEWRLIVAPTSGTFRSGGYGADSPPVTGGSRRVAPPDQQLFGTVVARGGGTVAGGDHRMAGGRRGSGQRGPATCPCSTRGGSGGMGPPGQKGRRMTTPFAPVQSFTLFPPAAGARILSLGGHQPGHVVTNDDLAAQVDTSDDWIRSRVGIVSRRIAGPDESVADMAVVAGGKALASSGLSPADIDLVIVATCSAEASIPNVSAVVAHRLGIVTPGAYDLNAACAGFCYALANAADSIRAGTARHVLVIGAEKMSAWIDFTDRSTCIIFADGAGAAVVGPVADGEPPGIGPVVWGSAGELSRNITIADRNSSLHQEGQAVFRWATTAMHPIAAQACERAGVAVSDLSAFVPHQANLRIIESIARKVGVPRERLADDIVHAGNTSSASIPLALSRMAERGDLKPGSPALLLGFGAGLCYAAQVITVP